MCPDFRLMPHFGERWVMSVRRSEKPTARVVDTYFRVELPDAQVVVFIEV
jgi:hypothetical protein